MRPEADISGATAAHMRLLSTVSGLGELDVRRPSLLDGWSIAHVLAHIARNADSYVRMLEAAAQGRCLDQYDGGLARRARDIESGAARSSADIIEDVRVTAARLEQTWSQLPAHAWAGEGRNASGRPWPCDLMPFHRWREVEIHHADLGLGFTWRDWSDGYIARELPRLLRTLPERITESSQRRHLAAWLLGRSDRFEEPSIEGWQDREDYYWT